MSATPTTLDHGVHTGGGSPVATGSVSPVAGRLLLLFVHSVSGSTITPAAPTVSGLGGTWTNQASSAYDSSGGGQARVDVFRCSDYGGSGALSIAYASGVPDDCGWELLEVASVDLTVGSSGVVQSPTALGTAANPSLSLAALASANNVAIGFLGTEVANSIQAITPGAGFSQLAIDFDNVGTGTTPQPNQMEAEWAVNQTTVGWTRGGTNSWGAIALEIASMPIAAVASSPLLVTLNRMRRFLPPMLANPGVAPAVVATTPVSTTAGFEFEALQGVAASVTDPLEAVQGDVASSVVDPINAQQPVSSSGDLNVESAQAVNATGAVVIEALAAAVSSIVEQVEGLAGATSTGVLPLEAAQQVPAQSALLPLEAAQGLATSTAEVIESTRGVTATGVTPIEALGGVVNTTAEPIDASKGVTTTGAWPLESLQGIASVLAEAVEALQGIIATGAVPLEALGNVATTADLPIEAAQTAGLTGVSQTAVIVIEALGAVLGTTVEPTEAVQSVQATGVQPGEATQSVAGSVTAALEALRGIAAQTLVPLEALGGVAQPVALPIEATQQVAALVAEVLESTRAVTPQLVTQPVEALQGILRLALGPLETTAGVVAALVLPVEAAGVAAVHVFGRVTSTDMVRVRADTAGHVAVAPSTVGNRVSPTTGGAASRPDTAGGRASAPDSPILTRG